MDANAHLGTFSNNLIHYLQFCLCQNEGTVNLTNQAFFNVFLIYYVRTTLLLSFDLVCDQRRSQFSTCFGRQSTLFLSDCLFSRDNLLFNLIQFSSNGQCPCSTSKKDLDLGSHLSLEQVVGAWAFPSMAWQCIHHAIRCILGLIASTNI